MTINKFMNKNVSDLSKIMNIDINNLSELMSHSVSTYIFKDTFTGNDGDDPNSTYWDPNQYLEIQNNQLHGSVNGSPGYVQSKFLLSGDFDVFVSFDDLSTGTTEGNGIVLIVGTVGFSETGILSMRRYLGAAKFLGNIKHNGSYYGEVVVARSNTYGGARIIRIGTTLTLKYKDGDGDWMTLTSNTVNTNDFIIRLHATSISGPVSGDFDDFTIDTGTMV
jgi:hypothetical protein